MKEGNKNISAPKAGMNRETHISQLKNTDYTYLMNGDTESQVGEGVNITNEPSNNLAVEFPQGYKVIHYKKDLLNNKTYYFLTNPETKKSSIGYVDDTLIENYNEDIYQVCEDCTENHNTLGTPLEDIDQTPSHSYVEIINDNCLPIGDGFAFDINFPIKFSELKQEKGSTNIYWNDKLNKPRWMCLTDVSYLQDEEIDCDGVLVEATCLKTYKLLQFPEHARLKIEPEVVQTGGTLKMGAYEFYAAYSNLYGDEATNYSTPTNPISIFDENNNILNDETTDSFTNYSIRLKVSNLDTRFKYYKVVCVETNNVNRTKSAFIAGIYPTTDDTIIYTSSGSTNDDYIVTGNSSIKRRVDLYELSKVRPEYESAIGDVESGGRKFMWGLKTKSEINLQPVVNLFGSLLKWQSNIAKESLYKTAIATSKYKGFMRNEVQPFAIRFLYKDGGYSANFPLIARPATTTDVEVIDINDINYKSINENTPICTTVGRDKKWQIFNTATLDSICEANIEGSTPFIEDIKKKCTISPASIVAPNYIEIPVIDGVQDSGLEEYIENNFDYVTSPSSGDIYTNLGQYLLVDSITGDCVPTFGTTSTSGTLVVGYKYLIETLNLGDNFSNVGFVTEGVPFVATATTPISWANTTEVIKTDCETPTLDSQQVKINEIIGQGTDGKELKEYIYKDISEYQKSLPSTFCNAYKLNQDDGKPIRDLEFETNFMGCDTTPAQKKVYFRNTTFQNEDCSYAVSVLNNNIPTQSGSGYYHNYYGGDNSDDLKGTRTATNTGHTTIFKDKLHVGALFFKVDKKNRDNIVFEITKNSVSTANDDVDDISDSSTSQKLRYTFYNDCSPTALPITGTTSTVFDVVTGSIVELDTTTFPDTFYVAVDVPFVSEEVPDIAGDCGGTKTTKYRTAPPTGCFSIYTRDVQPKTVKYTWDSIVLDKEQTYVATCTFMIPKVGDCEPVPYGRGKFAYWESTETYPNNQELYNSKVLNITPTDLQELTAEDKELFKEYFVDKSINSGTYVLKASTDFTCDTPIRHFKFPDNNVSPFMADMNVTDNSDALIFPLGVYLDPAVVRAMLQVAYNNNLITFKQLSDIDGYEILKGDNSIHKSVIANGLGYDMYKYEQKEKPYYYANYPHNDLGKDQLHYVSTENKTVIQHPFGGTRNNKYSFLSPDLMMNRITIPTEAVLSGYQVGTSTTTFQDVEDHPKWTILGDEAREVANTLATAETALEIAIKAASAVEAFRIQGGLSFSANPGVFLATAVVVAATAAIPVTFSQYRYDWLKIFDELGTAYNFASYGVSVGYHNRFIKNVQDGDYIRALPLRKYMRDGRYVYRDESSTDEVRVNNFQREHSIFLSTGKEEYSFNYMPEYYDLDNNNKTTNSSRTLLSLNGCSSEEDIKGIVGSPYISLKNYVPDQFGTIDSVKWLTTGYSEKIDYQDNCNTVILGGNVCISRFTWKRKIPIFKKNIVSTADKIPFNYGDYKNIGSPVYYCNYKSDTQRDVFGIPFPDINSDYKFDACSPYKNDFYVKPKAKMYLFYYGITDFLVESEINCNFRYAQNSYKEYFYPQVGDVVDWTQEKNVPIKEPNRFFYNNTYSQQVSNTPYRTLDRGFSKEEWERRAKQDSAVIYSEMDNSENDISDPWLIYKPLNWYEFPTKYGKLIQLKGVESEAILGRFENQMVKFNSLDKLQTSGDRVSIELGNAGIFASRPLEYMTTDLGYSGTQHSDMVNTPYGNFFVDAKRGQVFQRAGDELAVISDRTGQQPSGLKNWFREQLPFKLLKKFPEADIDNKYKSIGISMGWDSRMERVFLTKKDYIPVEDPCLKYEKEIGFYTDCGEDIITCPEGYTYNESTLVCEKVVVSDPICPDGYTYNTLTNTCTKIVQTIADCDCAVSEWSDWTACVDNQQSRTRTITTNPQGSGTPCPVLMETRSCSISIPCSGSLSASGSSGYYEIPIELGSNTGDVTLTLESYSLPDRFMIVWNNTTVADSLFVGDTLPNVTSENSITTTTSLNKYLYNGAEFDPNGSIAVAYTSADIANSTGGGGTLRSAGSVGAQIGVVANYPSPTAFASDGNVKLTFNKSLASPSTATLIAIGTEASTVWDLISVECPV